LAIASLVSGIRLISSSTFREPFLDDPWFDPTFPDRTTGAIPSISSTAFRDPYLDLPQAGSNFVNLPRTSYSVDFL
jgi:hypothetical protein